MNFSSKIQRTTNLSYLINGPNDAAMLLVEGMIRQLHVDATSKRRKICDVVEWNIPRHNTKECALAVLFAIEEYKDNNPGADGIEIALEVIRLHGGFAGSTHQILSTNEQDS